MSVLSSRFACAFVVASLVSVVGCEKGDREEGRPSASSVAQQPTAPTAVFVDVPVTTPAPVALPATKTEPKETKAANADAKKKKADGKALAVKKLVLATDVEKGKREPQGVATSFKKGEFERIYAFVEVANPGDESEVVVSFEPPSEKPAKGNVRLDVGTSPRWRTWATSKGFDETGEWTAVVSTVDGRELARETFQIL